MNVINLQRQHNEVMDLANYILKNIKSRTIEQNLNEMVKSINIIAGKLKIHLLNEDKYLYPNLLSSSDLALNAFGKKYSEEMKEVSKTYEDYKFKYNTASKIKQNIEKFTKDTEVIFRVLSNRINREEKELYPLLDR
ncbi:hemerythrin domain-containing protein [Clostridiaceae bacterium UIB06]|uniref:Hemerythrin domain-containing protein n=1 Tax=Clostridium thailandense TaxID=2794346 RepID=A0A949TUH6_9CLOT|nr:hemerythrin domain-containing protein [Clostridium thailandense]MBV7273701.1 hemerythrin domain-containing protein [Clostridium thailandense]MCH5137093.1 hemerythrin domain-containing protein [Clostridiaceae bacterium UIB06]